MSGAPACRFAVSPAVWRPMPFPPSSFWDFSTAFYARPGVAPACLRLQDRHGADVNLLLFAVWAAARGVALDRAALRAAGQAVADWQATIVRPLRELRRGLKTAVHGAPAELAAAVRNRVKSAELDAEHVEQLILGQHLPAGSGAPKPAGRSALARQNIQVYLSLLDVRLEDTDFDNDDAAAVELIVAAACLE